MRVWFFSDLHLTDPSEPLYKEFLLALDEPIGSGDHVVFAGDVFDLFVGKSRKFVEKNGSFFKKLEQLNARGVRLSYIEGNHDFHLSSVMDPFAVEMIQDEMVISDPAVHKRIYVAHGDLVDQSDTGYLKLRKVFRNPIVRMAVDVVPGEVIEKIAAKLSRSPSKQQSELPEKWLPADREILREKFRTFARQKVVTAYPVTPVDFVVLGHCHDLDEVTPFYWNMGYPRVHRQFLFYSTEEKSIKRRDFPRIS